MVSFDLKVPSLLVVVDFDFEIVVPHPNVARVANKEVATTRALRYFIRSPSAAERRGSTRGHGVISEVRRASADRI